jgi:hypothetical protein
MSKVIFDCGEIGWSMYHRAHLQWRHDQGETPPNVVVWTLIDRYRFYQGGLAQVVLTDLPKELLSPFIVRNNWLYNGYESNLSEMLSKCQINPQDLLHGFKDIERYTGKMVFKPFIVQPYELLSYDKLMEGLDRSKENIVLMPRSKYGAAFTEFRNWSHTKWLILYNLLLANLPEYNIIVCGKLGQVYRLGENGRRELHIINDSPLDEILWVLNDPQTVLVVSSQSFGGKLALLQNVDTLMWGHEKYRHQVAENWSTQEGVTCTFIEDMNYSSSPELIFETIEGLL